MEKQPKYNFDLKKEQIREIFNTPDYQEYKEKKKKNQKRRENIYQFTSIGNSTNIVKTLIIINVLIFICELLVPSIVTQFACYNISDPNFALYQPLTCMFLHGSFLHILFNMIVLWQFGNQLEILIGKSKFLFLYFATGIFSSILVMLFSSSPAVGASGALCGLLASYIFIAPETTVLLFFVIPMKIKNLIYGFMIFSFVFGILSIINPSYGFGIAHFGHLGGLISGYLITYYWKTKNLIETD